MKPLTDQEREDAFPVHIELGVKDGDRVSYPVAYLGDVDGIDQLPDEGCALVHFRKSEDGSVEMQRICLAADEGDEDDDEGEAAPTDIESALTQYRRPKKEKPTDDGGE